MATGSYDGGAGGPIRRQPFRRPPTPYDRPPTTIRNNNETARNGWLTKLVDPASRIIASSASKIFQSVFRNRPLALPDAGHEVGDELHKQEQLNYNGDNLKDNASDSRGINELEQLLQKKTFSRDEFDKLTELLRSRTVDLSANDEMKSSADDGKKRAESSQKGKEMADSVLENGIESSGLRGSISKLASGSIVPVEAVSPAELAKAFMGARPSRISPSTSSLRNRSFQEDISLVNITPSNPSKSADMSFGLTSANSFSKNGNLTPNLRGRSAIYNMARSPYARAQSTAVPKDTKLAEDGFVGPPTSYQWMHAHSMLSGGRQALKRRSSVLDYEFETGGPIRRIRQKSNLLTPMKDKKLVYGNPLNISPSSLGSDSQRPILLDGFIDNTSRLQATENGNNRLLASNSDSVPPQSSDMAKKILQELDKLVASPKPKSSELKLALAREKSPGKLTTNLLNTRALKSMEVIESPKQGTDGAHLSDLENISKQTRDRVEDNGTSKTSDVGSKIAKVHDNINAVTSVQDTVTSTWAVDSTIKGPAVYTPQVKRAFQMTAPEDSLELDDDGYIFGTAASAPLPTEKEKLQNFLLEPKVVVEAVVPSSESIKPAGSFTTAKGADESEKPSDVGPTVAQKEVGFTFPARHASETLSLSSSIPTARSSSLFNNKSVLSIEQQTELLVSNFESESVKGPTSAFCSDTSNVKDIPGPKYSVGSDFKAEPVSSNATLAAGATLPEAKETNTVGEIQKVDQRFRPAENGTSSDFASSTTQNIFAFGASSNSTLSNSLLISSASAASAAIVDVMSSGSASTLSSISSPSISASKPTFSGGSLFKFGSDTSASAPPNTVSLPTVSSSLELTESEPKSKMPSPFSSSLATSSPALTNSSSTVFGFSAPSTANAAVSSSSASSTTQVSVAPSDTFAMESPFGSQAPPFTQSMGSKLGSLSSSSPIFGVGASSSFGSSSFVFGSASGAKPFDSVQGFGTNSSASLASGSVSSYISASTSNLFGSTSQPASSTTSLFGLGSQPARSGTDSALFGPNSQPASSASSLFGSGSQPVSSATAASLFGSGSQPATSTSSIFGSSSQPASSTSSIFGSSSQPATSTSSIFGSSSVPATSTCSIFGSSSQPATSTSSFFGSSSQPVASSIFTFGSSSPSTSAGFSFGMSTASAGNGHLPFGAASATTSSGPSMFSFTSAATATSSSSLSPAQPVFQLSNAPITFGSPSPSNDQMNVEDSMAEDTIHSSNTPAPSFGQPANTLSASNFVFGSPAVQSVGSQPFQFGGQQNPMIPQNPSPFSAPGGNLELQPGGSFSLGTGGDKSNRKFIRARRGEKGRRK